MVLGLGMSVGLFFLLPMVIGGLFDRWITSNLGINLLEGVIRMGIFFLYMYLISRMKDMRRLFSYHGAEHKTIRCYEAKLPLTVENVRRQTRLHPRCGTSFLLVVMVLSILIFRMNRFFPCSFSRRAAAPTAPRPAPPPMATPPAVATWTRTCPLPTATWRPIPRSRPATAT